MAKKVIITCAVTGADDSVAKNPAVPVTPKQIATPSIDAAVHTHVRDPKAGKPSMDLALYRETVERIRDPGVGVLINLPWVVCFEAARGSGWTDVEIVDYA